MITTKAITAALSLLGPVTEPAPQPVAGPAATPVESWIAGRSVEGRPISVRRAGDGPITVMIIAGVHGDEPEGTAPARAVFDAMVGAGLPPNTELILVEDMNPDGAVNGTRRNANRVDLNRNYPADNFRAHGGRGSAALSEPESATVFGLLDRFRPDAVLALHSSPRGPFVNHDGPAVRYSAAFASAASEADTDTWRLVPDMGYPTPGSLGSLVGLDMKLPILTIEFERGHEPEGAHAALNAGVRALFGAIQPIAESVAGL
ncbi:MAG: DUF2817 domain-containing protein [Planctomycetota bacterium]